MACRYDERTSKTYKVSLKRYQDEHFRPAVYSHDVDVINTWRVLNEHMPPGSEDGHLFLSAIHSSRSNVWFKRGINVGQGHMRNWMKKMAKNVGIDGDITNKSGRVTSISRMCAAQVPYDVITSITGHRNEKTLARYDKSAAMKARAAQSLIRSPYDPATGAPLDYQFHYQQQLDGWHHKEVGARIPSIVPRPSPAIGGKSHLEGNPYYDMFNQQN